MGAVGGGVSPYKCSVGVLLEGGEGCGRGWGGHLSVPTSPPPAGSILPRTSGLPAGPQKCKTGPPGLPPQLRAPFPFPYLGQEPFLWKKKKK